MDTRASKSGVGDVEFRRTLFGSSASNHPSKDYQKLKHDDEEQEAFLSDTLTQQQQVMKQQDETLDKIGSSVGVLKDMSEKIGTEIGGHMIILDELGAQMDRTDSTMGTVMRKLQKVSRLSSDRSQWIAILVLVVILFVLVLLFFIL